MQEEFHGNSQIEDAFIGKLFYGWGTLNANVWLPSVSELVGTTGDPADWSSCYVSAMQGLNVSIKYWTDAQGGIQWSYFTQFNASGGGEAIMNVCNQQSSWLRSSVCSMAEHAWRITNASNINSALASESHAVHPAGTDITLGKKAIFILLLWILTKN